MATGKTKSTVGLVAAIGTVVAVGLIWNWLLALLAGLPVYLLVMFIGYTPERRLWGQMEKGDREALHKLARRLGVEPEVKAQSVAKMRRARPLGHQKGASAHGSVRQPRIKEGERERCLAYYQAVTSISAFWDRESTLFNSTLVKYLDSITESPVAGRKVRKAANRLVQATHEVIRRHEALQPFPNAALPMRGAYSVFFLSLKDWAEGTLAAMEALAGGMTPQYEYVQQLMTKYESAWREAQDEGKKLLKRLGLTADEIEGLLNQIHRSTDGAKSDNWQPGRLPAISARKGKLPNRQRL